MYEFIKFGFDESYRSINPNDISESRVSVPNCAKQSRWTRPAQVQLEKHLFNSILSTTTDYNDVLSGKYTFMWYESTQLLDVSDDFGQLYQPKAHDLPQIVPRFFVPPLEDKPQNPILEALNLESINSNLAPRLFQPHLLPPELVALSLNANQIVEQEPEAKVEELWKNALIRRRGVRVRFYLQRLSVLH